MKIGDKTRTRNNKKNSNKIHKNIYLFVNEINNTLQPLIRIVWRCGNWISELSL